MTVVPMKGRQVASAREASLPDTTVSPGGALCKEAQDWILAQFVAPMFMLFGAGAKIDDNSLDALMRVYCVACAGFTPEVYERAFLAMATIRQDPFRPPPAICRK